MTARTVAFVMAAGVVVAAQAPGPREISGVYPHLAMFNSGDECGTGAVVPWAGRLWTVTYAPHQPFGSDDKLYEIDARLNQVVRPESIGGTPANRMVHRESNQLFIGPYVIDVPATAGGRRYAASSFPHTGTCRSCLPPMNAARGSG